MKTLSLFICLLLLNFTLSAQQDILLSADGKESALEERMAFWKVNGMSAVIIKDGKVTNSLNWGFADPNTKRVVSKQTLYQAGSLSGTLAAIVALRAVEQGKLSLDKDINQYLSSWQLPTNRHTKNDPVTLRDILTKRRGFKQAMKPKGYLTSEKLPSLLQLLQGESPAKNKEVTVRSSTHEQGNYSYETELILQQLLEDVYQQPFEKLMQDQLLIPLGMKNSFFAAKLNDKQKAMAAVGFDQSGNRIEDDQWAYPELAASGLWTTSEDYAKVVIELLAISKGKQDGILSVDMLKAAFIPINHRKALIGNSNGTKSTVLYGGASMGFRTQFELFPEQGWGIVVFMNSYQNWKFMNEAMRGLKKHFSL